MRILNYLRNYGRSSALAILLIGGIALLQVHSIEFWLTNTDASTGWAWSLLIEGAALLAWSSAVWWHRWGMGVVATLLLLAGPLYMVSEPLVKEWQRTEKGAAAHAEQRAVLTAEIASLESALTTYLTNSTGRVGWAGRIDQAQAALDARRAELRALITTAAEPERLSWQRTAVIIMQVIGLVLLQGMGVLAINELRQRSDTAADVKATTAPGVKSAPTPVPEPIREPEMEDTHPPVQMRRRNWLHRV